MSTHEVAGTDPGLAANHPGQEGAGRPAPQDWIVRGRRASERGRCVGSSRRKHGRCHQGGYTKRTADCDVAAELHEKEDGGRAGTPGGDKGHLGM